MVKMKRCTGFSARTTFYELENGQHIEVLEERSNGETNRAWYVDENGIALDAPDFEVKAVYEPDKDVEDCYNLIGFEKVV